MKKTLIASTLGVALMFGVAPAHAQPDKASCVKLAKGLVLMINAITSKMDVSTDKMLLKLIDKGALTGKKNIKALFDAQDDDHSNVTDAAFDHAFAVLRDAGCPMLKK